MHRRKTIFDLLLSHPLFSSVEAWDNFFQLTLVPNLRHTQAILSSKPKMEQLESLRLRGLQLRRTGIHKSTSLIDLTLIYLEIEECDRTRPINSKILRGRFFQKGWRHSEREIITRLCQNEKERPRRHNSSPQLGGALMIHGANWEMICSTKKFNQNPFSTNL